MKKYLILLLVLALLTVSVSSQDAEWELTESAEIELFGDMTMSYPDGWFVAKNSEKVVINELEVDHERALGDPFVTEGYSISMISKRGSTMRDYGAIGDRTLESMLEVTASLYTYESLTNVVETTFMTWPALEIGTVDGSGNHIMSVQGYYGSGKYEIFEFTLAAPSAGALDAFLPTWDAMLGSITIYEGVVNIGDYGLSLHCKGSGSPTVIFESHIDGKLNQWDKVLADVGNLTRACAYNRLGIAPSDRIPSDTKGRTSRDHVDDLMILLETTAIEPPYVLVGACIGGQTVSVFTAEHPDLVEGIVLIDADHPDMWERWLEIGPLGPNGANIGELLASEGIGNEHYNFSESIAQAGSTRTYGDRPLAVIIAGTGWTGGDPIWEELMQDYANYSTNSRFAIAEKGDHWNIPIVATDIVIDSILWVLNEIDTQAD